jgi:hypothetical protein
VVDVSLHFTNQLLASQQKPKVLKQLSKYITYEVSVASSSLDQYWEEWQDLVEMRYR